MKGRLLRAWVAATICLSSTTISAATPRSLLPDTLAVLSGYHDFDTVASRLSQSALHPIEGIWQMTDDGAVIAIEQSAPLNHTQSFAHGYRLVLIESPCRRIRPGTVMGYAVPTAKAGSYDASIYTTVDDSGLLRRARRFTLTLNDREQRLSFIKHKSDLRIDLWRLIPYLFRVSIHTGSDRPHDLDGALRLFPESEATPINPRYL